VPIEAPTLEPLIVHTTGIMASLSGFNTHLGAVQSTWAVRRMHPPIKHCSTCVSWHDCHSSDTHSLGGCAVRQWLLGERPPQDGPLAFGRGAHHASGKVGGLRAHRGGGHIASSRMSARHCANIASNRTYCTMPTSQVAGCLLKHYVNTL
jgi:hypothetical protein